MKGFKKLEVEKAHCNPFTMFGDDWMLVTGGKIGDFNTMTASWGTFGEIWNKKVCLCFIRPERYTYEFMEKYDYFTLSFFREKYREVLRFCGNHSGREKDKIEETGITPFETKNDAVSFRESKLFFECEKIYFQDLESDNFLLDDIDNHYKEGGYHRMFIGEIQDCFIEE